MVPAGSSAFGRYNQKNNNFVFPLKSSWQPWSSCSADCATLLSNGTIVHPTRHRSKLVIDKGNRLGKACDDFHSKEEQLCNMTPCAGFKNFAKICKKHIISVRCILLLCLSDLNMMEGMLNKDNG